MENKIHNDLYAVAGCLRIEEKKKMIWFGAYKSVVVILTLGFAFSGVGVVVVVFVPVKCELCSIL